MASWIVKHLPAVGDRRWECVGAENLHGTSLADCGERGVIPPRSDTPKPALLVDSEFFPLLPSSRVRGPMPTGSSNRASEVLDALARQPTRRPMYRRSRSGGSSAFEPPGQATEDRNQAFAQLSDSARSPSPSTAQLRLSQRLPQWLLPVDTKKLAAGLVIAGLVVLSLGWTSMRRPGSLADRMPIASSAPSSQPDGANGVTDSSALGSSPSNSPSGVPPSQAAATAAGGVGGSAAAMPVFVHVAGAVLSSGVVELPAGSRVVDAVAAAGGLRPDADSNRVNLAATLLDGSQVMIPSVGQANPEQVPVTQGSAVAGTSASNGSSPVADLGPINLNTATLEQLDALPGVGPATAQAILAFRDKEGRFDSVEALLDVRGIGDAKFEALRELVTV